MKGEIVLSISVIIPAYNAEKYIKRCIESVQNQTMKQIEIIVVNDGSKDSTLKIVQELAENDLRIKVINQENLGVSQARNKGILYSKFKYIALLDSDDWVESDAYEKMYKLAEKNNLDMVLSDYYLDNDCGNISLVKGIELKSEDISMTGSEYLKLFLERKEMPAVWNKLYKKELYTSNDIYYNENLSYGEDVLILFKLILKAKRIGKVNKAFVHYISNINSVTNSKISLKYDNLFITFSEIEKYLKIEKKYEEWKDKVKSYETLFLSGFLLEKPYFKEKKYLDNFENIFKFFQNQNNLNLISKKLRLYFNFQKKLKSRLLMKFFIKSYQVIKK